MTGNGVSGSISVEFAPSMPATCRANSETATCMPRQMSEVRDLALAGDPAGEDLPLPPARAEAARDEDAVRPARAPARPPRRTCAPRPPSGRAPARRGGRPRASAPRGPRGTRRGASRTCRRARSRPRSSSSRLRSMRSCHSPSSAGRQSRPSFLADERVEALCLENLGDEVHVRARPGSRSPRCGSTSAKSAIFSRMSSESGSVERQTTTSGWMPMRRSSLTECCVGFVFSSPAAGMNGTSVTCR